MCGEEADKFACFILDHEQDTYRDASMFESLDRK